MTSVDWPLADGTRLAQSNRMMKENRRQGTGMGDEAGLYRPHAARIAAGAGSRAARHRSERERLLLGQPICLPVDIVFINGLLESVVRPMTSDG
jgi:hypothetical protein